MSVTAEKLSISTLASTNFTPATTATVDTSSALCCSAFNFEAADFLRNSARRSALEDAFSEGCCFWLEFEIPEAGIGAFSTAVETGAGFVPDILLSASLRFFSKSLKPTSVVACGVVGGALAAVERVI